MSLLLPLQFVPSVSANTPNVAEVNGSGKRRVPVALVIRLRLPIKTLMVERGAQLLLIIRCTWPLNT